MANEHIETERKRIHEESARHRAVRDEALQRYAGDVRRMREWLDEPARASEIQSAELDKIRAEVDRAERDFYEAVDRSFADINTGIEQALSQLAEAERSLAERDPGRDS